MRRARVDEDAFVPLGDAGPMMMGASPAMRGPFVVTPSMTTVTRGTRMTTVRVFLPTLPAGTRAPLVLFMPGFQLNSGQYAITLEHLASHGFVVLGADAPGSLFAVSHVEMAADGRAVIDWATSAAPFAASVDATRVGVTGHSLGGKLATLITMDDMRIDALLAIDPVDGDPSPLGGGGSPDRPDLVPSRGAAVLVPAGFIGETVSGAGGFMPCAPAAQNFTQFYMATTAAPWAAQWDMTGADHMDFLDNPAACGFTCSVCADGPAVDATIVANTRTLATAFFRRTLQNEGRARCVSPERLAPSRHRGLAPPLVVRHIESTKAEQHAPSSSLYRMTIRYLSYRNHADVRATRRRRVIAKARRPSATGDQRHVPRPAALHPHAPPAKPIVVPASPARAASGGM